MGRLVRRSGAHHITLSETPSGLAPRPQSARRTILGRPPRTRRDSIGSGTTARPGNPSSRRSRKSTARTSVASSISPTPWKPEDRVGPAHPGPRSPSCHVPHLSLELMEPPGHEQQGLVVRLALCRQQPADEDGVVATVVRIPHLALEVGLRPGNQRHPCQ